MRYLAAILATLLALQVHHSTGQATQLKALRDELVTMRAQSAIIAQTYEKKAAKIEQVYNEDKTNIATNYAAVIERLRNEAASADSKPATVARSCKSEQGESAERVRAELLSRLAEVARYADELKAAGAGCEKWAE